MLPIVILVVEIAFVIAGVRVIYSSVVRLQKKLDPANKPTILTYINELGAYLIMGVLLVVIGVLGLFLLVSGVFYSTPRETPHAIGGEEVVTSGCGWWET